MSVVPIRVLLLEDDPADARLVGQMLRRVKTTPFEVTVAGRLAQALERLSDETQHFDVVLADLGVPDSSGIGTLNALTQAAPRLPVVVLTGNDDDTIALEALKRGAQDYLVKGLGDAFILSRVVRYAIERKMGEEVLREARDSAEQAARAKSVFLAMMGHEIRTPLNGVLGMARLLLETDLDPRQKSFTETLVSSGELLLGLVNDILDFSRLDAEGMTLAVEPFDVLDTVEEVRLVLTSRVAEKDLTLTTRFGTGVRRVVAGDRLRLRQILFNLVGNAIKFTDHGGIEISVEPLAVERGQVLRFLIKDTGIGIGPEIGARLFTEFWQGDSGAARRFDGAGLGLAICKRLTDLMGGEIGYDSLPGQGTTFRVDLPLPPSEAPSAEPGKGVERPCRVLLVDDNEVNREVAAGLLERRGHQVVCARDGLEGVAAAARGGFDLILLDMRMPGMDGIETARAIRALPGAAAKVPIYLLTANPVKEDEARWREAGILGCLAKPFRFEHIGRLLAGLGEENRPPASPDPDLVEVAGLLSDLGDLGRDRMVGLVELFRSSSSADLAALRTHAKAGRLAEAGQLAHRMASAASSLHLGPLAAKCRAVEDATRADDPRTDAQAEELADLWTRSLAAVGRVLDL
ncbi:sensory box histidine kinase/response regulator [Paramagnetospirillum magnetotacticum MS-1]|uniref:histidine kinase n=1 Tax=Paramagnetospirillum magnetotacticum MS-1 TaxID=272627 RepID=A0A0C2YY24_PARME|nr:hybrid sensor histidine kinase/response regulator [Paramagnetospirillum magnetotacticum]KIL99998.1 sensory box histidine kinase/response regulator [Paramagnetospirillum magnetotacticum MS-1]